MVEANDIAVHESGKQTYSAGWDLSNETADGLSRGEGGAGGDNGS